jgi:hypothetical protein
MRFGPGLISEFSEILWATELINILYGPMKPDRIRPPFRSIPLVSKGNTSGLSFFGDKLYEQD